MKILVIGCGLSGAVLAERFASRGHKVDILEKRDHIGGNCFDYVDENGILVNKYGAHLFHTNEDKVIDYITRFSEWVPYEHKVVGNVDNTLVPIPVNINTVNSLFPEEIQISNEEDMTAWLQNETKNCNVSNSNSGRPANGEQAALNRVGQRLYEKIFYHYTKKQWDKYPIELDGSVLERIPVRTNFDDRYFTDKYQALPKRGYTKFFETLLESSNITVQLNCKDDLFFTKLNDYELVFYTGPIDHYFHNSGYPKLEYRSINFESETIDTPDGSTFQSNSVVNYPGHDVSFTRIVEYKHFLNQVSDKSTIVREYSTDEGEPYYPVPNQANRDLYESYKALADKIDNVHFVGRLANYKYFNMDQAILNALDIFENIIKNV
jgi:UDP-galactopyranose mutase